MNDVMDLALDGLEVGAFEEYPGKLWDVNGKFLSHDEVRDRVERLKSLVLQICICGRNVVSYYIKIGRALLEIRDQKLYRYAHPITNTTHTNCIVLQSVHKCLYIL